MNYSYIWKEKLRRENAVMIRRLERRFSRSRKRLPTEEFFENLEHYIFYTAFVTRKLKDALKLSDEFEAEAKLHVRLIPRRKRGRSLQDNWFDKSWVQSRVRSEATRLGRSAAS